LRKESRKILTGIAFLSPNILGFLIFTLFPLVFSMTLAFSNWDIRLHNMFRDEPLRFVGIDNFIRLFREPHFMQYFKNTLFLMLGIPFGIAGSLGAALLLTKDMSVPSKRVWLRVMMTLILIVGLGLLVAGGCGALAMQILFLGLAGTILIAGWAGGRTLYRTVFYTPHFTAGVATFLLWKKLYNPHTGPLNNALTPLLDNLARAVNAAPAPLANQDQGRFGPVVVVDPARWGQAVRGLCHGG